MIPGYPPNTPLYVIAMNTWGVHTCTSHIDCRKELGPSAHIRGVVDRAGTVHWRGANKRATKRGVRNLAKLIAIAYNGQWRNEPRWLRLYLTNVWAYKEIRDRLHYRVRAAWSAADRAEAWRLATSRHHRKIKLRTDHRNFYSWSTDDIQ